MISHYDQSRGSHVEFLPAAIPVKQANLPLSANSHSQLLKEAIKRKKESKSAPDRIGIDKQRMIIQLREMLEGVLSNQAGEFVLDARKNVQDMVSEFLSSLQQKPAIHDFVVVCDETNNSPSSVDNGSLRVDIAVKPNLISDFVYLSGSSTNRAVR